MKIKLSSRLFILLLTFVCTLFAGEKSNGGLKDRFLYKSFPLYKDAAGYEGTIELWLDKEVQSFKDPGYIYSDGAPPPDWDKEDAFKPAMLCLRSTDNVVRTRMILEKPHASLSVEKLYGTAAPVYLLEQDYTQPMGSYNGPITEFAEVVNGKILFLKARDLKTGERERIGVMGSLKYAWRIVPSINGKRKDILKAKYHPDPDAPAKADPLPFVTDYIRIFFNGKEWLRKTRTEPEGSEFEGGFPDEKLFPRS